MRAADRRRRAVMTVLPLMPRVLTEAGLCARHRHPELWTSSLPSDRQQAAAVCGWCPVLAACREWAAHLPASDNSVYAAMDAGERLQARRAAQETVPAVDAGDGVPRRPEPGKRLSACRSGGGCVPPAMGVPAVFRCS